ncbi:MAG: hypothetical protein KKI13_03175 [Candidatus Omnitrophica bacterium]|nr:hypothetical protein [Candidatus Omnitrophota bacterium]
MAILFLLTEWFLYSNRAELIDDYWNKFLINEHVLIDMPGDYDYLIMGDSVQKTGINPILVSEDILNLGLPGAKPMGQFLMLERYLKKHKPPKAIFLFVDPERSYDSLLVILRYFVDMPEFVSIWGDLNWEERRCFMMRYWASLDEREVRRVERDKYGQSNAVFINDMEKNHGYMPSPRANVAIGDTYFTEHTERYQKRISISKEDMKYLDKFMKLASSNDIKVVFLGFVVPTELHRILEKSGFNTDYLIFFRALQRVYPEAIFVDRPILHLENKYFGDMSHLNKEGSSVYAEYFKILFYSLRNGGAI